MEGLLRLPSNYTTKDIEKSKTFFTAAVVVVDITRCFIVRREDKSVS